MMENMDTSIGIVLDKLGPWVEKTLTSSSPPTTVAAAAMPASGWQGQDVEGGIGFQ